MRMLAFTTLVGMLGACADATTTTADLPAGWEAAERLEKLVQMTCSHSGLDDVPETLSGDDEAGEVLAVTYQHAHFRCEQPVEGYVREHDDALEVLVQPIDMNPDAVAGCDCRYTINMEVPLETETHRLTLFRRWDNHNTPNEPVHIGEIEF